MKRKRSILPHPTPLRFLLLFSCLLTGSLLMPLHAPRAQQTTHKLLFVGNSYTYGNAPHALNEQLQAMLEEIPSTTTHSERVAYGGYLWHQHRNDLKNTTQERPIRRLLLTSQDPLHQWNTVFFQEQSQIPGIGELDPYWQQSLDALRELAAAAQQRGAAVYLIMTWGRRDGDPQFPALFPSFKAMQQRLRDGYLRYQQRLHQAAAPLYIVPAGLAWEALYDTLLAQGIDPHTPQSLFTRLYENDGSHPSLLGSFLTAATLYAALTGFDPRNLRHNPRQQIPANEHAALLAAAHHAVFLAPPYGAQPLPWQKNTQESTQEQPTHETTHETTSEANHEATSEAIPKESDQEDPPTERTDESHPEKPTDASQTNEAPPLDTASNDHDHDASTTTDNDPHDHKAIEDAPLESAPPTPQGCCHALPHTSPSLLSIFLLFSIFSLRRSRPAPPR